MALQSGDFWILRYYTETNVLWWMSFSTGSHRIFTSLCVGTGNFHCVMLCYVLSSGCQEKYDIHWGRFTLGSSILTSLQRIGFHQIIVFV